MGCNCGGSQARQQLASARVRQQNREAGVRPRAGEGIYWTGPERAPVAPAAPAEKPA